MILPETQSLKKTVYILRVIVSFIMLAFLIVVVSLNMIWVSLYAHTVFTSATVNATGFDFLLHGISITILFFFVSGVSAVPVWTVLLAAIIGCITALFYWPPRAILQWKKLRYGVIVPLLCGILGINACLQTLQNIHQFGTKQLFFLTYVTMTPGPGIQIGLTAFIAATVALTIVVVAGEIFLYTIRGKLSSFHSGMMNCTFVSKGGQRA